MNHTNRNRLVLDTLQNVFVLPPERTSIHYFSGVYPRFLVRNFSLISVVAINSIIWKLSFGSRHWPFNCRAVIKLCLKWKNENVLGLRRRLKNRYKQFITKTKINSTSLEVLNVSDVDFQLWDKFLSRNIVTQLVCKYFAIFR